MSKKYIKISDQNRVPFKFYPVSGRDGRFCPLNPAASRTLPTNHTLPHYWNLIFGDTFSQFLNSHSKLTEGSATQTHWRGQRLLAHVSHLDSSTLPFQQPDIFVTSLWSSLAIIPHLSPSQTSRSPVQTIILSGLRLRGCLPKEEEGTTAVEETLV